MTIKGRNNISYSSIADAIEGSPNYIKAFLEPTEGFSKEDRDRLEGFDRSVKECSNDSIMATFTRPSHEVEETRAWLNS